MSSLTFLILSRTIPAVATVFAIESKNNGNGIIHIAVPDDLKGVSLNDGNWRQALEQEIPLAITPADFAKKASLTITADQGRDILSQMGISLPTRVRNSDHSTQILKDLPEMTQEQIDTFIQKALEISQKSQQ